MASIRARESGYLYFDFRYRGKRCREYTKLNDTPANRRKMTQVLSQIEAEITLGSFDYCTYFPNSPMGDKFNAMAGGHAESSTIPKLEEFAWEWFDENKIRWKRSMAYTVKCSLRKYLVPYFGYQTVTKITRADILKFRASIASPKQGRRISNDRINHVMTPLRQILKEAAYRYSFTTPFVEINPLRVKKSDVNPFTLEEVNLIIQNVRVDYKNYYTVRFFTGMRTGEIDGLKWQYIDFEKSLILIRETIVDGFIDDTKTAESTREIQMCSLVCTALKRQFEVTGGKGEFVFCNKDGGPLAHRNVTKRIWYPMLNYLGLPKRRPYQTRHTAATLWLGAGENPSWISSQLGHTNSQMLFTVYARYVPNLTRQDGSAFERLLMSHVTTQKEASNDG